MLSKLRPPRYRDSIKFDTMKKQSLKVSERSNIAPFFAMEVLRSANQLAGKGKDILHLEVGEPGFRPPEKVIAAAKAVIQDKHIGYTEALGLAEFSQNIARHYQEYYKTTVDTNRVVATIGASGAFLLAFLAAFDTGDRVGIVEPGYPAYRNILSALGLNAISIYAGPEHRFQPTISLIKDAGRLDGLIIASPSNPAGTMLTGEELQQIVVWCGKNNVRLVSDEIYHGIGYRWSPTTAISFDDQAIVINSFSKYFSMTGWRIGWMVCPPELMPRIERLAQNFFVSPSSLSQHAGIAALTCRPELDQYVASYASNRQFLLEHLPKAGLDKLSPADGAFYLYADVSHLTEDSKMFCEEILRETGVATTPGLDFDIQKGHRYLRISYAGSKKTITTAAQKLIDWHGF